MCRATIISAATASSRPIANRIRACTQVKHIYQYIHCQPVDLAHRAVEVKSWYDFTNLKDFAVGQWRLKADGKVIQSGRLPVLDLARGGKRAAHHSNESV